jgi:hypothetical protein
MARYTILGSNCYNIQNYELMRRLGVVGTKWPDAGIAPTELTGARNYKRGHLNVEGVSVRVWVLPYQDTGRKSSKHRAMCACPGCGREMSVGRLFQHVCAK